MPRDINGIYSLASGNPVKAGDTIEDSWANSTMDDLAAAMTDSLSRSGQGGMLAPFLFNDGVVASPGMAWSSEPGTGFYRAGSFDMRLTMQGFGDSFRWLNGVSYTRNAADTAWAAIVYEGGSGSVPTGTSQGNMTYWESTDTKWKETSLVKVNPTDGKVGIGNPTFTHDYKNMVLGKTWIGSVIGTGFEISDFFGGSILSAVNSSGVATSSAISGTSQLIYATAGSVTVNTSGTTRMTIAQSASHVGIGHVPYANDATFSVLDIGDNIGLISEPTASNLTYNRYFDGTDWRAKEAGSGLVMKMDGANTKIQFYTSNAFTAGSIAPLIPTVSIGTLGTNAGSVGIVGRLNVGAQPNTYAQFTIQSQSAERTIYAQRLSPIAGIEAIWQGLGFESATSEIRVNGAYVNLSDISMKTSINPIDKGLSVIKALNPVSFFWKGPDEAASGDKQLGFIAQQVQAVVPEAISKIENSDKLGMTQTTLLPIIVKAIQEIAARIEALEP